MMKSKFGNTLKKAGALLLTLAIFASLFTGLSITAFAAVDTSNIADTGGAVNVPEPKPVDNNFVPGEVLVGLKYSNVEVREMELVFPGLDVKEMENQYEAVMSLIPREQVDSAVFEKMERNNASYLLRLADNSPEGVYKAIEVLNKDPRVIYAEPNHITYPESTTPNDPQFDDQWGMPTICMPQVWDFETGSDTIEVGVLDTGIDFNHPDLASNIDLSKAFYVAQYSVGTQADVMDYVGHGTHVAGVIGAMGNNGVGVSGINWNVSIVPIKIALSNSNSNSTNAFQSRAILYAAALGIPVINMSYGFGNYFSQEILNALSTYNGLFVKSAGNTWSNTDGDQMFVEALDVCDTIFVASTDPNDSLSWFSCYGEETVAIAAPGYDIYSTMPVSMGSYGSMSGTSMASPHVAGAAALLMSAYPNETAAQIKSRILESADSIPVLDGSVTTGGRLNVYKALAPKAVSVGSQIGSVYPGGRASFSVSVEGIDDGLYDVSLIGQPSGVTVYGNVQVSNSNGTLQLSVDYLVPMVTYDGLQITLDGVKSNPFELSVEHPQQAEWSVQDTPSYFVTSEETTWFTADTDVSRYYTLNALHGRHTSETLVDVHIYNSNMELLFDGDGQEYTTFWMNAGEIYTLSAVAIHDPQYANNYWGELFAYTYFYFS